MIVPTISSWYFIKRILDKKEYDTEIDRHDSQSVAHGYELYSSDYYELLDDMHKKDVNKRGFWNRIACDIRFAFGVDFFIEALHERDIFLKFIGALASTLIFTGCIMFVSFVSFLLIRMFFFDWMGCVFGSLMFIGIVFLPIICWFAYRWEYIKRH